MKTIIIFTLITCTSLVIGQESDNSQMQQAMEKVIEKQFAPPPFDLTGNWQLLVPFTPYVMQQTNVPLNYYSQFMIWDLCFHDNGTVLIKYPPSNTWEEHTWEYAIIGSKFYIRFTGTEMILKILYFNSMPYLPKSPERNKWKTLQNAWAIGQNEIQISQLAWKQMMNDESEILERQIFALEKKRTSPNIHTHFPQVRSLISAPTS